MINSRIQSIREMMKSKNIDAYIIHTADPHQSEYLAPHWQSREWATGFTGSAGTAIITQTHAGLWTDSRYFIQAETELMNSEIVLHKIKNRALPQHITWLSNNLAANQIVAIDSSTISLARKNQYESILKKSNLKIKLTNDLISNVWKDRPPLPTATVFGHDLEYTGMSRRAKLDFIKKEMTTLNCNYHLITTLDDIAWILNLRGRDIECNPVFISFLLISQEKSYLFINEKKIPSELRTALESDHINIMPYDRIASHLKNLSQTDNILLDTSTINVSLYDALKNPTIVKGKMPSRLAKSMKNDVEIDNLKKCMIKDGVALTHAFYKLENLLNNGQYPKENEFADILAECRSQQPKYYGESFNAIVGYNANGAIVHYHPQESTSATIKKDGVLLVDSGGQYHDGTTDITRTMALSAPTIQQKRSYTNVLKGHIALANAVFPEGTTGGQLDILARQFLWNNQTNFLHGTGHGVGYFLNVHEGPQSISPAQSMMTKTPIELGMVTSNEPGYYEKGEYGIRIENLILTVEISEGYYGFETITLFPIDTTLIDISLMTTEEITWINNYHQKVFNKLLPSLEKKYHEWLRDKCQKI